MSSKIPIKQRIAKLEEKVEYLIADAAKRNKLMAQLKERIK